MPTTKPRYMVTDAGRTAELLDMAADTWPHITDRKQLLLKLADAGATVLAVERRRSADARAARRDAIERSRALLDEELLLGDIAWR